MTQIIENGKWYNVSIQENGDKFYYLDNKLHREKGPAIELVGGAKVWYLDGQKIECSSQKEFETHLIKTAKAQPKNYDVKIETMLPATLTFRIVANSPEEALAKAEKSAPQNIKYRLNGKKNIKGVVYDLGSVIIRLTKNLIGK